MAGCWWLVLLALVAVACGQDERLPGESLPSAQRLSLTAYLEGDGDRSLTFEGTTSVDVTVVRDAYQLVLHAGVSVSAVRVRAADGNAVDSSFEQPQDRRRFLVVSLAEQASSGSSLKLEIDFSGDIGSRELGFAQYPYQEDGQTKAMYATQFEPNGARLALPCYDEPAVKARYTLSLRVRDGLTALSHTHAAVGDSPDADGFRTFRFEQTPLMSVYLLAWVVSDVPAVVSPVDANTTIWTVQSTLPQAVYASYITPSTIASMEQLVGVPYRHGSLTKMDHVAVPSFIEGAMENWGIIIYTQGQLLVLENYTSEATKEEALSTMQHEVAHQWFGDLVSPNWWSVLWLNEGFATYFQSFATAVVEPTWRLQEVFTATTLLQSAMTADIGANIWPLTKNISSADDAMFDYNIYQKGASVIWMMENIVGTDAFYTGLNKYLTDHQFSNVTDEQLFAALDAVAPASSLPAGGSVTSVMLPWARQAGFPAITVTRNYSDGSAVITQAPYLSLSTNLWPVALTHTTRSEADFSSTLPRLWLLNQQLAVEDIAAPDDWLLLNLHVAGYYRVNYDEQNWALVTEQLLADPAAVPAANRGQLLDDAASLAGAAYLLPASTGLRLVSYLSREDDYIPWMVGSRVLRNFELLVGADAADEYNEFALSLVEHVTATLGYRELPGEDHVTRIFRAIALGVACNYGQAACLNSTYQQFQRFMADPDDPETWVDPDLKRIVYCQGMQQGGSEAYQFLMELYQTAVVISEINDVMMGMTCSSFMDSARLLELTATGAKDGFRREHLLLLLESLLERPNTVTAALDFLQHNVHHLTWPGEKRTIRNLLMRVTMEMRDEQLLDKVGHAADALDDALLRSAAQWRRDVAARGDLARREAVRWLKAKAWRDLKATST